MSDAIENSSFNIGEVPKELSVRIRIVPVVEY
jgi:hypothetical protein